MVMSRYGALDTALDWFVHYDGTDQWYVTVSNAGDRIFSFRVDVPAEDRANPAIIAARLWPALLAENVWLDVRDEVPTLLQAEVRSYSGSGYWPQAYGWLWHNGKVVAYRSHPAIRSCSREIPSASPERLAQQCFAYAAELQTD
ncbi:hypothetical protein AYM40_29275 [Paraburkholderia phytofirmans OLGA172]|uniref:Uncharacterized protein n=2 Tax=Paraburkholderia phytofirmans TaxID=261302 RepID=A0A160FUB6_9BURK|nr:hypothetical protein AYM40_29275 [Paraburkholderia phytofirmans OLGA172]